MSIAANLDAIRKRVAAAARRAGRDPSLVSLVVVTKGVDVQAAQAALSAGARALGENRVQEWLAKKKALPAGVEWHLIGTLQLNKVKYLDDTVHLIHSLDRLELARALDAHCRKKGLTARVLVQVNVSGEKTKHGVPWPDLEAFLREVAVLEAISVQGLMTMAPAGSPAAARAVFRSLREAAGSLAVPGIGLATLSMGMSDDFETAVEEGATMLRIGRAVFAPGPAD